MGLGVQLWLFLQNLKGSVNGGAAVKICLLILKRPLLQINKVQNI